MSLKTVKACAVIVAVVAPSILFSERASAAQISHQSWNFDSWPGRCDSFCGGSCGEAGWFTGGRGGYDDANGNVFLWLWNEGSTSTNGSCTESHQQNSQWNSWNTWFGAGALSYYATKGVCHVSFSRYDPAGLPLMVGLVGRDGKWLDFAAFGQTNGWLSDGVDLEVGASDWYNNAGGGAYARFLLVFGFWGEQPNARNQSLALDDVTVDCFDPS
jgi:hypothetical protein